MSKHINVNPDHYKVAGRERPGKDVVQEEQRQAFEHGQGARNRRTPHIPNQEREAGTLRRRRAKTLPRRRAESA